MADLEDEGFVEGDAGSTAADAPGVVPADDDAPRATERAALKAGTFDSTSVTSDAAVLRRPGKNARAAESRKAFAEAILASKAKNAEVAATARPATDEFDPEAEPAAQAVPAAPVPAGAAIVAAPAPAAPPAPSLDPEVRRLRDEAKAERDRLNAERAEWDRQRAAPPAPAAPATPGAPSYEDYVDRPSGAYRNWLESMRGEKFTSDDEFRLEARDFVTSISADVLGVALPEGERNGLESRLARKAVRVSKTAATRREAELAAKSERERSEAETKAAEARVEQEWDTAASHVSQMFAAAAGADGKPVTSSAATSYPWLASYDEPGKIVVDVIRSALVKDGTQLSWQEASKKADEYLAAEAKKFYDKRAPLLAAKPAAVAKPDVPAPPAPPTKPAPTPAQRVNPQPELATKFSKEKHLQDSLAKFRTAFQPKP